MAPQRFDNRVAQIVAALFGGFFVVVGLSGLVAGSPVTGTVYLLFGIYTIVRGQRSSLVIVEVSGVTARSMVRTRRYPWSE
ncbi:MAG: hypothetical protein KDB69_02490, partial [Acidimicrobiia bacterium]|nr:hypothetical protein [Acidimicrobiia bacterium]